MSSRSFWEIQTAWRAALFADTALQAWAQAAYGRSCSVWTGFGSEECDLPGAENTPLVMLMPSMGAYGPGEEKDTQRMRVVCCVHDDRFVNRTLTGLQLLATDFGGHVLRVIAATRVGGLTGVDRVADDYELADFPMLYRTLDITLKTGCPIGSRITL